MALCALVLSACGSGAPPAGLFDFATAPDLHGLPIPPGFRVVGKTESPHGFDNEPVLPPGASITLRLRTRRPIDALSVLTAIQRRLVRSRRCFPVPLGIAGYADTVACERHGVAVEYRAADWDTPNWERRKVRELTVTVSGPRPPED